jgi:hypothetical protein
MKGRKKVGDMSARWKTMKKHLPHVPPRISSLEGFGLHL